MPSSSSVGTVSSVQLNPRYGDHPIIHVEGLREDPVALMVRQHHRLAALLAGLDDAQWQAASRCEGWTVQDVITHLTSVNQFWAYSIATALAGAPSTFLASFDPVRSPAELVAAAGTPSTSETLASFVASLEALDTTLDSVGDRIWDTLAEAPPGHVAIGCVAMHALWDSGIHERDIALPLGLPLDEHADELAVSLIYAAALNLAFHASTGSERTGALEIRTSNPDVHVGVELTDSVRVRPGAAPHGAFVLTGSTLEALEALSCRTPLAVDVSADHQWLFDGLSIVFDQSTTG